MAKFLRTSGISFKIEDIIVSAKEELVVVSPYLQISNNLFERLKEKSDEGVRIDFVYGKSKLTVAERKKIESLKNINLYYYENLHAKCYYNEQEMIITSMNLYEFSEKNNREMGVLINKAEDVQLFDDSLQEVKSIIAASRREANKKQDFTMQAFPICSTSNTAEQKVSKQDAVGLNLYNENLFTDLLTEALSKTYPNNEFVVKRYLPHWNRIASKSFESGNVDLEVYMYKKSVSVQFSINNSVSRNHHRRIFKNLFELKGELEVNYPVGEIDWDGAYSRIKINLYSTNHNLNRKAYPDFYTTNSKLATVVLRCIDTSKQEIINRIDTLILATD